MYKYATDTWICRECRKANYIVERHPPLDPKSELDIIDVEYCRHTNVMRLKTHHLETKCPDGSIFVWGEIDVE